MTNSENKPLVIRKQGETIIITRPSQTKVSTATGTVTEGGKPNLVDLVFTIDTTGSMSDKIDALLHIVSQFVKEAESFAHCLAQNTRTNHHKMLQLRSLCPTKGFVVR